MKIKLRDLVDVGVLNLEWVGVSGETKFQLRNGAKKVSHWKFLKCNYDDDCYFPDDEVNVSEIGGANSIWKIVNKNGTTCVVKFFNLI